MNRSLEVTTYILFYELFYGFIIFLVIPVSYTHLDVYKRQQEILYLVELPLCAW